jgi:hypothetical protein
MNFADILGNVRRLVEDESSLRWTDKVISEYVIEGVNEVFRRTGGVTDSSPYDFVSGQSEYIISEKGRITAVKIRPENNVNLLTLNQVQVEELPIDFSNDQDPSCYAISQIAIQGETTESAGELSEKQKILFDREPARSTNGAGDGIYGFYVETAREFTLDLTAGGTYITSGGAAEAALNTEVIPVLSKFDRFLTNMVAGNILMELNDMNLYQKGQVMAEKARRDIGNIGYVNSISMYARDPGRLFP